MGYLYLFFISLKFSLVNTLPKASLNSSLIPSPDSTKFPPLSLRGPRPSFLVACDLPRTKSGGDKSPSSHTKLRLCRLSGLQKQSCRIAGRRCDVGLTSTWFEAALLDVNGSPDLPDISMNVTVSSIFFIFSVNIAEHRYLKRGVARIAKPV